jgi:hypothetical protein
MNYKVNHKVEILGDSHLTECANNLNQFLNSCFTITSLVKPGAPINELVSSQSEVLKLLKKSDVIVIGGGANNMNNSDDSENEVILKITDFVQKYKNTNIIVIEVPHRFDLSKDSGTNIAIRETNAKLRDLSNSFSHVFFAEIKLNRDFFTKHGLHLNKMGKTNLAKSIANLIYQIDFSLEKSKSVILSYQKEVELTDLQDQKMDVTESIAGKKVVTLEPNSRENQMMDKSTLSEKSTNLNKSFSNEPLNVSCTSNLGPAESENGKSVEEDAMINCSSSVCEKETRTLGSKRKAPIKRSNDFLW